MVELLLSFNAKVNATTLIGWTPLHDASAEGQAECATILIDRGGTVDAENDDGNTPLVRTSRTVQHSCRLLYEGFSAVRVQCMLCPPLP